MLKNECQNICTIATDKIHINNDCVQTISDEHVTNENFLRQNTLPMELRTL